MNVVIRKLRVRVPPRLTAYEVFNSLYVASSRKRWGVMSDQ